MKVFRLMRRNLEFVQRFSNDREVTPVLMCGVSASPINLSRAKVVVGFLVVDGG